VTVYLHPDDLALLQHRLAGQPLAGERHDLTIFPDPSLGVSWTRPQGGLFVWVRLPEGVDASELLKAAVAQKVAFVPGESFFTDGTGKHTARLNFSNATPERISEGVGRLALCLRTVMSRHAG
jgi:DNA-binding transcriptional MocR family regulator